MNLIEQLDARKAKAEQGIWLPANNGTETPFYTRSGKRVLYCWQPSTGKHAYLDTGTDMFIPDSELSNYF